MTGRTLRGRVARGSLALAGVLVLALASELVLRASGVAAEEVCGPFEAGPSRVVELAADWTQRDPGILGAATSASGGATDPGAIVPLPEGAPDSDPEQASEALLALPKNAQGAIPTEFELGPGATIAHSFFSPVLCATVARVTGPPGARLEELVAVVPETGIVVPNDVYASAAAELTPPPGAASAAARRADPYLALQYGLALSGVRAARELGAGEGVRIALLDSAPELAHRDLAPSGIESAGASAAAAPAVHGTLMAGVLAAAEGNGFGIAGVAPKARIVSIPICIPKGGAGGACTIYQMLQGFDRAHSAQAAIVNLSLSGPPNPLLERGVARLEKLGMVVVAAAGNEGSEARRYPAAYPSVIGVGAIDRDGRIAASSNRGSWVELYAPGVEILSTVPGSAFAFGSGTSLAAAHVTGSLAVLTGITGGDPLRARSALFRALHARADAALPVLPTACDAVRRIGKRCGAAEPARR